MVVKSFAINRRVVQGDPCGLGAKRSVPLHRTMRCAAPLQPAPRRNTATDRLSLIYVMFIRAAGRTVGERVVHGVLVDEHEIVVRAGPLQGLHGLDVPVVSPGADVGGVSPVLAHDVGGVGADVGGVSPVPAQMWVG